MIAARHLLVLGTFLLAILLDVVRVCISTAQEQITADLALAETQFDWVLSSFALAMHSDRFLQECSLIVTDRG